MQAVGAERQCGFSRGRKPAVGEGKYSFGCGAAYGRFVIARCFVSD